MGDKVNQSHLVFGVATVSASRNSVNGDAYFIKEWSDCVLLALIDGLGHGKDAAEASALAKKYVAERFSSDVAEIMMGLHGHLSRTRGAVVGLARIDKTKQSLSFCGVGNIEVKVLSDPPMHPTSLEGIVGMNKIRLKKFEYRYIKLNALVLYSDGISSKFELPSNQASCRHPQEIAEEILSKWWNKWDDATVILAMEETQYH